MLREGVTLITAHLRGTYRALFRVSDNYNIAWEPGESIEFAATARANRLERAEGEESAARRKRIFRQTEILTFIHSVSRFILFYCSSVQF